MKKKKQECFIRSKFRFLDSLRKNTLLHNNYYITVWNVWKSITEITHPKKIVDAWISAVSNEHIGIHFTVESAWDIIIPSRFHSKRNPNWFTKWSSWSTMITLKAILQLLKMYEIPEKIHLTTHFTGDHTFHGSSTKTVIVNQKKNDRKFSGPPKEEQKKKLPKVVYLHISCGDINKKTVIFFFGPTYIID